MEGKTANELLAAQASYWALQDATVEGMLGGFGFIAPIDEQGSRDFLNEILGLQMTKATGVGQNQMDAVQSSPAQTTNAKSMVNSPIRDEGRRALPQVNPKHREGLGRALDCGAGIGRVAKNVLLPVGFCQVDLLDVQQSFLDSSIDFIGGNYGERFCSGMAEFDFSGGGPWHVIWVQWCAIYLSDEAFVDFFRRAGAALDAREKNACVVLKENVLRKDVGPEPDDVDSSVTRSLPHLKRLFGQAGLEIVKEQQQRGFPRELYPVYMLALRPTAS